MALDHSPEAARNVLWGLYGWADGRSGAPELIEVSIKSPRNKWHAAHWEVGTLLDPETIKHLVVGSEEGHEIYMGCVGLTGRPEPTRHQPHPRGNAALRGHTRALWLDVDCQAPGREGSEYFATVDDAIEIVDAALGQTLAEAALVVGSGWGVQYWIPLYEPVYGAEASRVVRALVGWLTEVTVKKIDRVWDVTRVMRMPGTWNWRGGPEEADAVPTGVLRWPEPERAGLGRLGLANVIDALGDQVSDVLGVPRLDPELDGGSVVDALLERYAPAGSGESGEPGSGGDWAPLGDVLLDLDRMAEALSWADVLEPYGWRCISGGDDRSHEQVWERPGKTGDADRWAGERSAVVYADKPALLVVYSDSTSTGFAAGLRGAGRRGSAAGVGVISKWRAWVDLECAGDVDVAKRLVREAAAKGPGTKDGVLGRLAAAWKSEMDWVEEWTKELEWSALMKPHTTRMDGSPEP